MNMHFGYWTWKVNPLGREAMLERMNLEVLHRLALPRAGAVLLADLGCGAGATARCIATRSRRPAKGPTVAPFRTGSAIPPRSITA